MLLLLLFDKHCSFILNYTFKKFSGNERCTQTENIEENYQKAKSDNQTSTDWRVKGSLVHKEHMIMTPVPE